LRPPGKSRGPIPRQAIPANGSQPFVGFRCAQSASSTLSRH
jgi:hypothetical protein